MSKQAKEYSIDRAQLGTILAALRTYQRAGYGDPENRPDDIHDIATDGQSQISLDDAGINALCESLNKDTRDYSLANHLTGQKAG